MATLNLADFSAVMNLIYGDRAVKQFRTDLVLANLLAVDNDKNSTCTWPAKFFARSSAGPRNEGHDAVDGDFTHNDRLQATLAWAQYFGYAKVSGLSQALAAANGGPGIDVDALEEEVDDALDELSQVVGADLYAGNVGASPIEFEGLARAVDSTGTYAGISQGAQADWASGENSIALASISVDNIRTQLHRPFKDATGKWPEFDVCPGNVWDAVAALFNDQTRQNIAVDEVMTSARGLVNLKAAGGFRAIMVDGVPLIEDKDCTANTMYSLHSRWLSIRQVPAAGSSMHPSTMQRILKNLTGIDMPEDDVAEMMRSTAGFLQPSIEALDKTGDNMKVMAKVYAQLRLTRRQAASKLIFT